MTPDWIKSAALDLLYHELDCFSDGLYYIYCSGNYEDDFEYAVSVLRGVNDLTYLLHYEWALANSSSEGQYPDWTKPFLFTELKATLNKFQHVMYMLSNSKNPNDNFYYISKDHLQMNDMSKVNWFEESYKCK